jgi:hypothetical protein
MRLLLDTHALLWWLTDGPQLSRTARSAIADPAFENFPIRALWKPLNPCVPEINPSPFSPRSSVRLSRFCRRRSGQNSVSEARRKR